MLPSRSSLETILRRCGIELRPAQYDAIWSYHHMLRDANADLNLTRIHQFENMVLKHYVDSLLVLQFVDLPSPLIDMGSGPGLPGIPLKIARPDVKMILAEPRGARADFLKDVCRSLDLKDIEVVARKVNASFPLEASGVITRAVASIPETLDRVSDVLKPGGTMLFMKGPDCSDEIREAESSHQGIFALRADHAYTIPGTPHERRLVIYERLEGPSRNPRAAVAIPDYTGPIREVSSDSNPGFKVARELLTGRGIRKHGQALISGNRIVSEVLARHRDHVLAWVTPEDGPQPPSEYGSSLTWMRLARPLFEELDTAGTKAPMLLTRVPAMPEWDDRGPWPEGPTVFVPFQDPENVGAVIRSAAALNAARVVLLKEAANPFHPRSARAAGPALFSIPLLQGPGLHDLKSASEPIFALSAEGADLASQTFPERFGLLVGMEGPGLPDAWRSGDCLRIPINPAVESLNAATSAAIALYEWRRQTHGEG